MFSFFSNFKVLDSHKLYRRIPRWDIIDSSKLSVKVSTIRLDVFGTNGLDKAFSTEVEWKSSPEDCQKRVWENFSQFGVVHFIAGDLRRLNCNPIFSGKKNNPGHTDVVTPILNISEPWDEQELRVEICNLLTMSSWDILPM